jgi:hypothetical protein
MGFALFCMSITMYVGWMSGTNALRAGACACIAAPGVGGWRVAVNSLFVWFFNTSTCQ